MDSIYKKCSAPLAFVAEDSKKVQRTFSYWNNTRNKFNSGINLPEVELLALVAEDSKIELQRTFGLWRIIRHKFNLGILLIPKCIAPKDGRPAPYKVNRLIE